MTMQFYRVWKGRGRVPSAWVAKVWASSAADAIKQVRAEPFMRGKDIVLEAEPSHLRKVG